MIMKSVETLVDERTIGSEKFGANLDMKKNPKSTFSIFRYEKKKPKPKFIFAIFSRVNILSKLF